MDLNSAVNIPNQSLRDIIQSLKNMAFSDGGFAEGTNDHTIKTTATITYMVDGVLKSKTATDNIAPTVCASQAAGRRCRYLVSLDASGNVQVTKGTEVVSLTTGALTTLSWDATEKKLRDSAGTLSFVAGDMINVSGFTEEENNGVFHVEVADPNGYWAQVRENGMVDEAEGDSVTVLRESALPNCPVKQAAVCIILVTTGTTAFIVGTDDITDDIGTGSVAFTEIGVVPTDIAV